MKVIQILFMFLELEEIISKHKIYEIIKAFLKSSKDIKSIKQKKYLAVRIIEDEKRFHI